MITILLISVLALVSAGPATENYKDQFCTDPRTMQKHQAYTEWADAYSCTRHRCQPGGRNLAIYTVGCKRVEAPESAIECEEVVEDTNMQFPYCCTRLRCLVVVRGEVWTRVLGQPWETLPAAPWSHMYKMKKPPPGDNTFLPKVSNEGPIYELSSDVEGEGRDKVLRANKKTTTESPDCNEVAPRAVSTPDIVIALSTSNDPKEHKKSEPSSERARHKRLRKTQNTNPFYEEEALEHHNEVENEEPLLTEKPADATSEEKVFMNAYGVTQKPYKSQQHHQVAWTEIPPGQWNEHEVTDVHADPETAVRDGSHQPDFPPIEDKTALPASFKEEKPTNLQALVDAIGTRMRDIENVVQRMSEKVHQVKPVAEPFGSAEKRSLSDVESQPQQAAQPQPIPPPHKHHKDKEHSKDRTKRPNTDDHYKRFSVRNRGSKYLHSTTDSTTEQPLFVEDNNMNGYFSDASNSVLRRLNPPKLRRSGSNSTSRERTAPQVLEEHGPDVAQGPEVAQDPDVERRPGMEHASHSHEHLKTPCNHSQHHGKHILEPAATYMAPVENRRKSTHILTSEASEEMEKKHKKRSHKRKKGKGKSHRKHHKEDKKKHASKLSSVEMDRNVVSLEDSSAVATK